MRAVIPSPRYGRLAIAGLIAALAVALTVYLWDTRELSDAPVVLGDATFNEANNTGRAPEKDGAWASRDFRISTGGTFFGTFDLAYRGDRIEQRRVADVLFVAVVAAYKRGDNVGVSLASRMLPIACAGSSARSRCTVDGTFEPPPMNDGGGLWQVWITLTWVRVYDDAGTPLYHVFPGTGSSINVDDSRPAAAFDEAPQAFEGGFAYYDPIGAADVRRTGEGQFGYATWIEENAFN